jgi:hypothetical protein
MQPVSQICSGQIAFAHRSGAEYDLSLSCASMNQRCASVPLQSVTVVLAPARSVTEQKPVNIVLMYCCVR